MGNYSKDIEEFLNEIPTGKEDVHEYYDELKAESKSKLSLLFGDKDTTENDEWYPVSQIEYHKLSNGYEVVIPYWLAKKKGLAD